MFWPSGQVKSLFMLFDWEQTSVWMIKVTVSSKYQIQVRFSIIMVTSRKMALFWDVALCSLLDID
jgi:hypothetical protein